MASFRFSLQRLLELRQEHEKIARFRLAQSQRALLDQQARLIALQEACAAASEAATPVAGTPIEPALLLNNDLHLARLRLLAAHQETAVRQCSAEAQSRQAELQERARHRAAIERLRARRLASFIAEQRRREHQVLDEAGLIVFTAPWRNPESPEAA